MAIFDNMKCFKTIKSKVPIGIDYSNGIDLSAYIDNLQGYNIPENGILLIAIGSNDTSDIYGLKINAKNIGENYVSLGTVHNDNIVNIILFKDSNIKLIDMSIIHSDASLSDISTVKFYPFKYEQ